MKVQFLADQCVPVEIVDGLRRNGYRVILLKECLPVRSPDELVIAKAQQLDCVLLSLNGDFADIVRYPPGRFAGIIAIQLHNHPETINSLVSNLVRFIEPVADRDFFRGKLLIVEVHRIRIRGLNAT